MQRSFNGRVDIKSPNTSKLFEMYDKIPANQCSTYRNNTDGLWDETSLSKAYFSQQNEQILQNGIRAGVYNKSNGQYVIGPQDCDSLKIIMRSIFLQNAANQPTNITGQIEDLNKIVTDYCVKQVYSEAQGYMKYLDDASTLVIPMAHPVLANTSNKTLEMKPWF
jgi:hypothetical protein